MRLNSPILTVLALSLAGGVGLVAATKTIPAGMQPYTPTKLEWLAVELNATSRLEFGAGGVSAEFRAVPPSTIAIDIVYRDSTTAARLQEWTEALKRRLLVHASNHGWSWVRVETSTIKE